MTATPSNDALRDDARAIPLPNGPSWRSVVEGYTSQESYEPGDVVAVHCSSAVAEFSVQVTRVGARREVVWSTPAVPGEFRDVPDDAPSSGCGWPSTFDIPVGPDWRSGFYEIRFSWPGSEETGDEGTYACFVVRSTNPTPGTALLVLSTTTWQAYNEWGGSGIYRGESKASADRPYDRGFLFKRLDLPAMRVVDTAAKPDPRQTALSKYFAETGYGLRSANAGWFQWERLFVEWAETNGYALDYATSSDLHFRPEVLEGRQLMLSVGHDEYWSAGMRDTVEGFAADGGNIAFFSGDLSSAKIRFEPDGRSWSSYLDPANLSADPEWPDGDFTALWGHPALDRPEAQMSGVSTGFAGYGRFGLSTPRSSRGFTIQLADHWALAGTGLQWGDTIGIDGCLAGFEMCGCEVTLRANRFVPTGRFGTPSDAQILAVAPAHLWRAGEASGLFAEDGDIDSVAMAASMMYGPDPDPEDVERVSNGWATMLTHEPGGTVFTAATTEWASCLGDDVIAQITTNVMNRFLGTRTSNP
jgi:hypothetical protein